MTISTEPKVAIVDWLATKLRIRHIDAWENDATIVFPTFFVGFSDVSELDDPVQALHNAMIADQQFPTTLEAQEAFQEKHSK